MKCIRFYALLSSLFVCSVHALPQPASKIADDLLTGWNSISTEALKRDVTYLASAPLKGRLTLEQGDAQAIYWIAEQFRSIGLKPAVHDSYLQPVSLIEYVPDREHSYIALDAPGKVSRWKKPEVMTEFRDNIHLKGEVVFAGYGITAPDLRYDDYQYLDVSGKMVLVFEHEPQERKADSIFNGTANTIYATNRIKALNAEKHGAIAILIAPEPTRKHLSNQERQQRIGGSTNRKVPAPSMVLAEDELHIPVVILSDKAANAIAGKTLSLAKLQADIDTDLKPQSQIIPDVTVTIHDEMTAKKSGISYNVAGLLEGSDPALKAETVIISAHHDHDGVSENQIWHGADDNASGTAGVIALARAMAENSRAENGLAPRRSVLFVVFTAEERGLIGSYYMASHPLRPLETTRAMINFDMIGRNEAQSLQTNGMIDIPANTTNRLNLIGSHYSPDYKNLVVEQNKNIGLTIDGRFDREAALNVFFRSDQFPFLLKGIPSFWWFTGFHPDYHHTSDTADKINYVKMQKILRLAYLSTYQFADQDGYPAFIKNPGLV